MNERNLSRRLSSSVVDALKAQGHILVVKGGATALARELDELMAPEIATIEPRLKPYAPLVGEPTSTFGDETVDQAVEDMVQKLTHALMRSDHVEDVFAEDAVIRRDIFRVVRDGLREPAQEAADEGDHASVTVKLDTLGYVAATAGRRADPSTLRQALDRAASVAGARFSAFSPELREATFRLEGGGIDERLEIEEAVADELTDLVEQGVVELPTIERRIDLGRALSTGEQRALRPRIEAAAEATLRRSGCAASWELADPRTIRVLFTPLSDQDARGVDPPTSAFAREIATLLASRPAAAPPPSPRGEAKAIAPAAGAEAPRPPTRTASPAEGPRSSRSPARPATRAEAEPAPVPTADPTPPSAVPKRKAKAKEAPEAAPEAAPKAPAKRVAKTSTKPAATKKKVAKAAAKPVAKAAKVAPAKKR